MASITIQSCRICLINNGCTSLFENLNELLICDLVALTTNVKISKDDGFLKTICFSCIERVNAAFEFKKDCENSDNLMRIFYAEQKLTEFEKLKIEFETEYIDENWEDELNNIESLDIIDSDEIDTNALLKIENVDVCTEIEALEEFTCNKCFKIFDDKNLLIKHEKEEYCVIEENKLELSPLHNEEELPEKSYLTVNKIDTCSTKSFHLDQLDDEKKSTINEIKGKKTKKTYKCNKCDKTFIYKQGLKRHFNTNGHKKFVPLPGTEENLELNDNKKYKCNQCNISFSLKHGLERHKKTQVHLNYEVIKLQKIKKEKENVLLHIKDKYKCNICDIEFIYKQGLNRHLKTLRHQNNKQFESANKIVTSINLNKIEKQKNTTVAKKIKFKCDVCDITFVYKQSLKRHYETPRHLSKIAFNDLQSLPTSKNKNFKENENSMLETISEIDKSNDSFNVKENIKTESLTQIVNSLELSEENDELELPSQEIPQQIETNSFEYVSNKNDTEDYNYKCDICNMTFIYKQGLKRHFNTLKHLRQNNIKNNNECTNINNVSNEKDDDDDDNDDVDGLILENQDISTKDNSPQISKNKTKQNLQNTTVKNDFACDICNIKFIYKQGLKRHYKTLRHLTNKGENGKNLKLYAEKMFKCELCNKDFLYEALLKNHYTTLGHIKLQNDHENSTNMKVISTKNLKCDICDKQFLHKELLYRHLKTHNITFICNICNKIFKQEITFKNHLLQHVNSKKASFNLTNVFECNLCHKKFTEKAILNHHMKSHNKDFICEICSKQFMFNSELTKHQRTAHFNEKPFKCDICDKRFNQKPTLKNHLRIHTGERPFVCSYCNKTFRDAGGLCMHLKIHTGDKKHKCEVCLEGFTVPSQLIVHKRIHTGERPFKCQYCDKRFIRNHSLTCHIRTHTGEKPHKCDICEKTFRLLTGMRRHKLLHSGEKPFNCNYCESAYAIRDKAREHMKYNCKKNPNRILRKIIRKRKPKK